MRCTGNRRRCQSGCRRSCVPPRRIGASFAAVCAMLRAISCTPLGPNLRGNWPRTDRDRRRGSRPHLVAGEQARVTDVVVTLTEKKNGAPTLLPGSRSTPCHPFAPGGEETFPLASLITSANGFGAGGAPRKPAAADAPPGGRRRRAAAFASPVAGSPRRGTGGWRR